MSDHMPWIVGSAAFAISLLLPLFMLAGAQGKGPLAIGWTVEEARLIAKACWREVDGLAPDPSLPHCR